MELRHVGHQRVRCRRELRQRHARGLNVVERRVVGIHPLDRISEREPSARRDLDIVPPRYLGAEPLAVGDHPLQARFAVGVDLHAQLVVAGDGDSRHREAVSAHRPYRVVERAALQLELRPGEGEVRRPLVTLEAVVVLPDVDRRLQQAAVREGHTGRKRAETLLVLLALGIVDGR